MYQKKNQFGHTRRNFNLRTAVILCGGRGTRLGSLGKKIPKALVKIQGQEILWYIFNILKKYKFNHLILPIGYKGYKIRQFCKRFKGLIKKIDIIDTGVNSDIGKRIYQIKNNINSKEFLLLNGDAIFNFNLNKIFDFHKKKKIKVTFISGETTYPYGTIGVKKNRIVDFNRNLVYDALKIRKKNSYVAYNYTGMSIINTKILDKYSKSIQRSKNFEIDFFPKCIKNSKTNLVKLNGFWRSVDNLKDIDLLNNRKTSKIIFDSLYKLKKKIFNDDKKKFLER